MYKITVTGLKQIYEFEYYIALRKFIEFVEGTDNSVQLFDIVDGKEKVLNEGYTSEDGVKHYKNSLEIAIV